MDTDRDTGQFYGNTFVGSDDEENFENSWGGNLAPNLTDDEIERNQFPKSPYQEAVEMMGDQKPDYDAIDKMVKSAKKGYLICIEHVGLNFPPLQKFYSQLKQKYKTKASESIDRLIETYNNSLNKIKAINESGVVHNLNEKNFFDEKSKLKRDKIYYQRRITISTNIMNFVKDFFEEMKIIHEILGFENIALEFSTEKKWPVGEEVSIFEVGTTLVTPKRDLQYLLAEYQKRIKEVLEKLNEQIQIFDKNKIDMISNPVENW